MSDVNTEEQSTSDSRYFRPFIGVLCVVGSLVGFAALFVYEVPEPNKDAMMLALGIIFGWGSAVVQSEYGATSTGRKVAESAIRKIERQDNAAADAPAGTVTDPTHTTVVNPPDAPVPVSEH